MMSRKHGSDPTLTLRMASCTFQIVAIGFSDWDFDTFSANSSLVRPQHSMPMVVQSTLLSWFPSSCATESAKSTNWLHYWRTKKATRKALFQVWRLSSPRTPLILMMLGTRNQRLKAFGNPKEWTNKRSLKKLKRLMLRLLPILSLLLPQKKSRIWSKLRRDVPGNRLSSRSRVKRLTMKSLLTSQ